MATRKALDSKEWNEVRTAAEELKGLGGDAAKAIRRAIKEATEPEPEPEPGPEPGERDRAIIEALEWLTTPEAARRGRPPRLMELSDFEYEAVATALSAVAQGIEPWRGMGAEIEAEDIIRTNPDRRAGRLGSLDGWGMLKLLEENPIALHSFRIRDMFLRWLKSCTKDDAEMALNRLRRKTGTARDWRGVAALYAVSSLRASGLSEDESVRRVAACGVSSGEDLSRGGDIYPGTGLPEVEPMSETRLRSLLKAGRRFERVPREAKLVRRPGRKKRGRRDSE